MLHFAVCEICFLLIFFGNGGEIGWLGFLHGRSNEGGGGIYDINNFLGTATWRFRFPDGDIEAKMVPSSMNNFLLPLLHFVMVRSNHNERLVRISLSPELMLMLVSLGSDRCCHKWSCTPFTWRLNPTQQSIVLAV
jgi:hypothetical protein